ncbi:uncharacterized protein BDR25DRAFT_216579, partial [Lindgomyces ingoldianus]
MPTRHNNHNHDHHHNHLHARATPTRSNLGPLTTTFTPPAHCTRPVVGCTTCSSAWAAQSCFSYNPTSKGAMDDTACWPKATSYPRAPPLAGLGFYSPGLLCPTGYTSACSAASRAPGDDLRTVIDNNGPVSNSFQFPLIAGETAVGCCPTGFTCTPYTQYGWQTCHAVISSTRLDAFACDGGTSRDMSSFSLPFQVGAKTNAVTVSTVDIWAPLIQLNWQKTDRSTSGTASSTETSAASANSDAPFSLASKAATG